METSNNLIHFISNNTYTFNYGLIYFTVHINYCIIGTNYDYHESAKYCHVKNNLPFHITFIG